jgi:hypothetical protein
VRTVMPRGRAAYRLTGPLFSSTDPAQPLSEILLDINNKLKLRRRLSKDVDLFSVF